MKLRLLLLCGAALLVAGCNSPQGQFANTGEFMYSHDLVPQPLELTPAEMDLIEHAPAMDTFKGTLNRNYLSQE